MSKYENFGEWHYTQLLLGEIITNGENVEETVASTSLEHGVSEEYLYRVIKSYSLLSARYRAEQRAKKINSIIK